MKFEKVSKEEWLKAVNPNIASKTHSELLFCEAVKEALIATDNEENISDLIQQAKEDVKSEITEEYKKDLENVKTEFNTKLDEKENEINSLKSQIETLSNAQSEAKTSSNEEVDNKINKAKEEVQKQINDGDKAVQEQITYDNVEKDRQEKLKDKPIEEFKEVIPADENINERNVY